MPELNTITINDGTADYVYTPRGIDPKTGVASLVNSTGVPMGARRLTFLRSTTQARREKVSIKMTIPVVATETVNGVARPTVLRSSFLEVTVSFDEASSQAERASVRNSLIDLLGDPATAAVIDDLETMF